MNPCGTVQHQNCRPNILVEPGCYDLLNMGDVAMLQVTVDRLRNLWPSATIHVLTDEPERLLAYCPQVEPIPALGRHLWFQDGGLFSPFHRLLPEPIAGRLIDVERTLRRHYSVKFHAFLRLKKRLQRQDSKCLNRFLSAAREADLVVVSGQGSITDSFHAHALNVLDVLGMAISRGTPTALFGQGLGPLSNPRLRARAKEILPFITILALREGRAGLRLLDSLEIDLSPVVVTGDDAIELAYGARTRKLGTAIGVNLRVATYSQVDSRHLERIGSVVRSVATKYGAPIAPVPIALGDETSDPKAIRQLIDDRDVLWECEHDLDTPLKVIVQAGSCRVVVAGSYHAAVFAMAQGIPTVCLANSAYYFHKFTGLAHQFGTGCEVIRVADARLSEKLEAALEDAWEQAETARDFLLDAAVKQIEASRAAYYSFYQQVHESASHKSAGPQNLS